MENEEEGFRSCPRCDRTLEPGEKICSYCGCVVDSYDGSGSMYESGTLTHGTKPLIDTAKTKTKDARMKIVIASIASLAVLMGLGVVLQSAGLM